MRDVPRQGVRRRASPALLFAALVGISACSGPSTVTPSPAPNQSSSTGHPASSPTGATPDLPTGSPALRAALLTAADLPAGFHTVPTQTSGTTGASSDPHCAGLVTFPNTPTAIGSLRHVDERLSGGQHGPFVDEQVDQLDSPAAAAAEQAQLKAALASCSTLTVSDPGGPPSTAVFASVPPPPSGQNAVAFRATVTNGASSGFEFTQVSADVGDVVVTLSFVGTQPAQIDQITTAAIARATRALTPAPTGTP